MKFIRMRPWFMLAGSSLLLCGCASSERMNRLSGGIVSEYAAPKSYRIRSEKYQQKSRQLTTASHADQQHLGGIDESLVNLWPFMFRTKRYLSVLWPFMDFDDFGMAIRPFYNQEGDDYSILFPLSAWNAESHSGWCLNAFWDKNSFGLFPLGYQRNTPEEFYCNYLIFGHQHQKQAYRDWLQSQKHHAFNTRYARHTWIGPYYASLEERLDQKNWEKVNWYHTPATLAMLNYMLKDKAPQNRQQLDDFRLNLQQTLPICYGGSAGLFPLSHYSTTGLPGEGYRWRGLLGMVGISNSSTRFSWDILGPIIARYRKRAIPPFMENPGGNGSTNLKSWLLLSYYHQFNTYASRPDVNALRELHRLARRANSDNWTQLLPQIQELLAQLPGQPELPPDINQYTIRAFLQDLAPLPTPDLDKRLEWGCLPLFNVATAKDHRRWSIPLLLTYGRQSDRQHPENDSSTFFSLPLMTYTHTRPYDDRTAVLPPFLWYSHTTRKDRTQCAIHDRSARRPTHDHYATAMKNDYAALGLYFRGHYTFYVAREGLNATNVERLRKEMEDYQHDYAGLKRNQENLKKERRLCNAWNPRDTIQFYRKKIREEELRLRQIRWDKDQREHEMLADTLKTLAQDIGFDLDLQQLTTPEGVRHERERLFDRCAEPRALSDIGSGLLYRKEIYHNGDYHWNFLGFLAGGSREKGRESTQILHFLYRHRLEGDKEDTVFFPFVSIQKDGDNSRFSFLWRVFQRKVTDGKTSGYVLFIPY